MAKALEVTRKDGSIDFKLNLIFRDKALLSAGFTLAWRW